MGSGTGAGFWDASACLPASQCSAVWLLLSIISNRPLWKLKWLQCISYVQMCVHACVYIYYTWVCVCGSVYISTNTCIPTHTCFSLVIETGFQILSIQHVLKFILLLPDAPTSQPTQVYALSLSLSNQIKKQIKAHKHAKQKKQTKDQ